MTKAAIPHSKTNRPIRISARPILQSPSQISDHIRQSLPGERFFQLLRHQRNVGRADLLNTGAQNRFVALLGSSAKRDYGGRIARQYAIVNVAVFGGHDVMRELRLDGVAGVENGSQQLILRLVVDAGKVRPDAPAL